MRSITLIIAGWILAIPALKRALGESLDKNSDANPNDSELRRRQEETKKRHENLRTLRTHQQALEDIPHQRFLRLVGQFQVFAYSIKDRPENALLVSEFAALRVFIDDQLALDGRNFARNVMADHVHNLHMVLSAMLPIVYLEAQIYSVRDEYRSLIGEQAYQTYLLSGLCRVLEDNKKDLVSDPEAKTHYEQQFRAHYLFLVDEIRKLRSYEEHVENTRGFLIQRAMAMLIKVLVIPLFILIVYFPIGLFVHLSPETQALVASKLHLYTDISYFTAHDTRCFTYLSGVALISFAAIAGAIGSFVSISLRIQGVNDNRQLAHDIVAFRFSEKAVRMAPVTGMVFAVILSLIFGSGLVSGLLFPSSTTTIWTSALFDPVQLSKWLIWCFLAGFSERMVPDMIDQLSDRARKADDNKGATLAVVTIPKPPGPS